MHRYEPSGFDFKAMKSEVSEAMQHDWKRDKVDDAKKRAIYQSKNYDDFKQRVAGCTLKPIHKDEFNAPPKFNFNRQAPGRTAPEAPLLPGAGAGAGRTAASGPGASAAAAGRSSGSGPKVPRSGTEFEREFRRLAVSEQAALLELLDGPTCAKLFGRELDAELLRQVLLSLEAQQQGGSSTASSRRFLSQLAADCPASTTRAASFFGSEERDIVARLLAREADADGREDVRICAVFGLPPAAVASAAAALAAAAPVETTAEEEALEPRAAEAIAAAEEPAEVSAAALPSGEAPAPVASDAAGAQAASWDGMD